MDSIGEQRDYSQTEAASLSTTVMHSHCENCVSRHCTVKSDNVSSCPMALCEQGCGAKFHQCLQSEHSLLCQDERVVCINVRYGCPLVMPRRKLGSHLEVCPASVMCCPTEWNRWPMYSVEDKKKMPLPSNILKVRCGQLDVALAMRDQRMLVESLNAPKKTRKILRNRLTTRYPAAPFSHRSSSMESDMLTSEETSRNVSDDEGGSTPWNLGNYPPGLQRSVCSRLIHATKQTTDSLSSHSLDNMPEKGEKSKSSKSKTSESIEQVDISTNTLPSNGAAEDCDLKNEKSTEIDENRSKTEHSSDGFTNNLNNNTKLCDMLGVDINIDCITKYQPKPPEMFTFLCAQEFRRDEYAWHFKNIHNDIQSCLNGWMEQRCPLAYLGCTFSFRRFVPCKQGSAIVHSALSESFGLVAVNNMKTKTNNSPDVTTGKSVDSVSHVENVQINNIMDCSQPQNVRSADTGYDYNHEMSVQYDPSCLSEPSEEIEQTSDGSNMSSQRDIEEEVFTSYRAYSPIHVQSRRLKTDIHCWTGSGLGLLSLPFEVLQLVARRLDSFSLFNLALTSKLLRDVCCSLLDERGIVIQVWDKVKEADGKIKWQSFCNRWRFSTAFSPVKKWHFSGNNPIGEHLKICPFNQDKIVRDSPFFVYPPGDAPMDHELRSLLAERQRESVSVKLRELHQWYQQFQDVHDDVERDNRNMDEDM